MKLNEQLDQLDLGLREGIRCRGWRQRRRVPGRRADWWFEQMRRAVEHGPGQPVPGVEQGELPIG